MRRTAALLALSALTILATSAARADNGSATDAGGSFNTGTAVGQNISIAAAVLTGSQSTLSLACPITSYGAGTYQILWTCAGGSVTIASPDHSIALTGTILSGSMSYSGSGGGRGGHTSYNYDFSGSFSGTVTANGITGPVYGSLSQIVNTKAQGSGPITSGSIGWNSAYSPLLVADPANSRLVAADNITGANLLTYGSYGNGVGQFESIAGLAQDSAGRLYIADSALDRIVRIDDLTGANWTAFGTPGSATAQFNQPLAVAIDSSGKIWIADAGNDRIVRMDDLAGTNWTAFGTGGTGVNQFSAPSSIAFDPQGRIYITDAGNNRLVRFDDLTGRNWTPLTQVQSGIYSYAVTAPSAVAVNFAGKIFIALPNGYLYRADDITGANAEISGWAPGAITGISLDKSGTLYTAGSFSPGLAQVLDGYGTGYFASAFGGAVQQPNVVLALLSATPTPAAPAISMTALSFGSENTRESTASQQVLLTNLGETPLTISSIAAAADFPLGNSCPGALPAGASCSIAVSFDPVAQGARSGTLSIQTTSVHPNLTVSLTGFGTAPHVLILPKSLAFDTQALGSSSAAQSVTVANVGNGPLNISSIAATAGFTQTNNCGTVVSPGNGCTLLVGFHPTASGPATGTLTLTDDAYPLKQTLSLSGTGGAPAFTLTPESLLFPDQRLKTASSPQTITVKNNLTAAASLSAATYSTAFSGTTNCGPTLAGGASCSFQVQFAPQAAGPYYGQLTLPIAGQPSLSAGLSGNATYSNNPSAISITPASVDFGIQIIGDNPSLNVAIANLSGRPTGLGTISLAGTPGLSITGNSCPAILGPHAGCTVEITFLPSSNYNYYTATLTIVETAGAQTKVPVTGQAGTDGGGTN